jgi:signal transduction histidine kinase
MADNDSTSPAARAAQVLRRAALGAFAAELGHELQGPMNLFRLTKERLARGDVLDNDDVALLGEELERLSRLCGRLRQLAHSGLQKTKCSPLEIVEAALCASALDSDSASLELELDADPALCILCDPSVLGQAVRELIDNALAARASRAGVRFNAVDPVGLCVWDDGAGFTLDPVKAMSWGVSTRPSAAGVGLTLALRAARAHGFSLELRREAGLTEAWLLMSKAAR